ncbi:aldehyde dehydrogenase family protein [Streptomyces beijiangensis]|uniref:Aldehyde dehydrogenase n=1 Tax=Streptomyces beijiangensis TaxID=163361 RepID=A0A939F7C8_9ACTN|nr:aldehyde dehydrogenase family protein [Streptomyces beijiangensis]MBO0513283.1 aldehyde dehydrogenase family protein [Streptomyces beijiangensis]
MTDTTAPRTAAADDDAQAISELRRLHATQRRAFLTDPYPSVSERKSHLAALAHMVLSHRDEIRAAMSADFGVHPPLFTDLVEVLGFAGRAQYAAKELDVWMADGERHADPTLFGTATATVRYQPKGVIGLIVPWNFPFDLALGPLTEMLAAGNRVVIKPSEEAPACAELLHRMVTGAFDEDRVAVSVGGVGLARHFPAVAWDHLLFTGSPRIGREVARAAATNLTPLTLELGGKCPALLDTDSVDADTVRQVIGTKLVKNGQMCISVDHVLVPRTLLDAFVAHAQAHIAKALPDYASGPDCTGLITGRHLRRITAMVEQARDAGARILTLGGPGDPATRRLPLTLVIDPPAGLRLMEEEIFGPVLPVIGYDDLTDALTELNAGPRPLALYVFSKNPAVAEHVLRHTTSGGACVNVCAVHGALPALAFGGVGHSGYGRHHGVEGFREFSNPRGVVVRGTGDLTEVFLPPYTSAAQSVVQAAFHPAGPERDAPAP